MRATILLALLLAGCGETAQSLIEFPFAASGSDPQPQQLGRWTVTLEQAQIGFGPAYFCTTAAADSDLCPAATLEWLGSQAVDALDPSAQPLGLLRGQSGPVRSLVFDYGISWRLTERAPAPTKGAPDGHSAVLVGRAETGTVAFTFRAEVDAVPRVPGAFGAEGLKVDWPLDQQLPEEARVRFDPYRLVAALDWDALNPEGAPSVVLRSGTAPYNALVIALVSTALPSFTLALPEDP